MFRFAHVVPSYSCSFTKFTAAQKIDFLVEVFSLAKLMVVAVVYRSTDGRSVCTVLKLPVLSLDGVLLCSILSFSFLGLVRNRPRLVRRIRSLRPSAPHRECFHLLGRGRMCLMCVC